MKNIKLITASCVLGSLALASCSTNKLATTADQDNLYFMASDTQVATQYAVQNNNPESFKSLSSVNTDTYSQENFSSRNVNPDYIAKYQAEAQGQDEETVYFDETGDADAVQDIDVYNNYYSNSSGFNSGFNSAFSMGMGFGFGGYGMGGFGFPGFGMDRFGMGGYGMGGFYNPFFGFGPRFGMNIGFGWGSPFMGMGMGMGFGNPMYGFPMFPMYGFGNPMFGYPMYGLGYPGFGYPGYGNPIYVLPGGEYGDRNVVVGARPTRGATLAGSGYRGSTNSAAVPSTARAQARNEAMNTNGTNRRVVSSGENSRVSSRDFSNSQNDYYTNSRSRVSTGTTRNVNSPAVDRGATTRSRSAMPTSRPSTSVGSTNSRSSVGNINTPSRSNSSPSYNRSTSPSYNRSTSPSYNQNQRSTSPSYNRSVSPSRSNDNSPGYSAPSRSSSSPSFSSPSRSSGGSMGGSSGGGASGGSRTGRGN